MTFPQRLSMTGIIGLAALSATHWMRENISDPASSLAFALGVMPNLAAAFAMPLLLASFVPLPSRTPLTVSSRRAYLWVLVFTTCGLCGWEVVQARSERFVFDVYDIIATGCGSFLALLAYRWHASTFNDGSH
jgi:glycopeptide antibiotics resistance protein